MDTHRFLMALAKCSWRLTPLGIEFERRFLAEPAAHAECGNEGSFVRLNRKNRGRGRKRNENKFPVLRARLRCIVRPVLLLLLLSSPTPFQPRVKYRNTRAAVGDG